jgi:hypothetical protein
MAWTTPRTWTTGELVTKTIMDTHIRDNLNALKDPPSDNVDVNESSDYYTSSGTFVDVGYPALDVTITTAGGDVLIVLFGTLKCVTGLARCYLDLEIDGTTMLGGDDGLLCVVPKPIASASDTAPFCLVFLATGVDAGEHTFTPKWKTSAGTMYLFAGAGTTNYDLHPQLWAREVS